MSKRTENRCVDCGLPCLGRVCPNYSVSVYHCDDCGCEGAEYRVDGDDLCKECTKIRIKEVFDNLTLREQADVLGVDLSEIY